MRNYVEDSTVARDVLFVVDEDAERAMAEKADSSRSPWARTRRSALLEQGMRLGSLA